ncbi:hypothetical protein J6590_008083 [Homalodisca vitripennis]|nr:hypothetical protein J6590_008083 [Homalodisca vitripennis]
MDGEGGSRYMIVLGSQPTTNRTRPRTRNPAGSDHRDQPVLAQLKINKGETDGAARIRPATATHCGHIAPILHPGRLTSADIWSAPVLKVSVSVVTCVV